MRAGVEQGRVKHSAHGCKLLASRGVAEVRAGVFGLGSELLLNTQDLVVLGQTLGAAWGASLDLENTKKTLDSTH